MATPAELKIQMEGTLAILEERLARIAKHMDRDEPISPDWSEQAQAIENDEVIEGLDEHVSTEIIAIKAALERIANDEYGECMRCGEEVAPKRLEAIPWATTCINCAQ